MIHVDLYLSDCTIRTGWTAASSVRPSGQYSFYPFDKVCICHPNAKNLRHRDKTGVIQDRLTFARFVWIKFSDGSYGAVDPIALFPDFVSL